MPSKEFSRRSKTVIKPQQKAKRSTRSPNSALIKSRASQKRRVIWAKEPLETKMKTESPSREAQASNSQSSTDAKSRRSQTLSRN